MDDWQDIHAKLVKVSQCKGQLDYEEARWLVAAKVAQVHKRLGYGTFSEYLGMVFGYKAREARERLAVARRLAELPQMAEGLRDGELVWSAVRELCRVVTPDTETVWLEAVRDKGVRALSFPALRLTAHREDGLGARARRLAR